MATSFAEAPSASAEGASGAGADGAAEASAKRQRVDESLVTSEGESQVHSSSIGPRTILYLHTANRSAEVNLERGEIILLGREPALPQLEGICQSDHEDLSFLPDDLRNPPRVVRPLMVDDSQTSKRHGIIWADDNDVVFMRALPDEAGMCKNGIRVKLAKEWHYAVSKKDTLFETYPLPHYASKICVDRNKTNLHVHLDWVKKFSLRELLCIGCSPTIKPLADVGSEINEVAHQCQWGPDRGAHPPPASHPPASKRLSMHERDRRLYKRTPTALGARMLLFFCVAQ